MPKPVCVICQRFLEKEKSGVRLVEMYLNSSEIFKPYKVWSADFFRCSRCAYEMVSECGAAPILEHHQDNFKEEYGKIKNEDKFFVY